MMIHYAICRALVQFSEEEAYVLLNEMLYAKITKYCLVAFLKPN